MTGNQPIASVIHVIFELKIRQSRDWLISCYVTIMSYLRALLIAVTWLKLVKKKRDSLIA